MGDLIRVLVLLFGGAVVGLAVPILLHRGQMWNDLGYPRSAHTAYLWLLLNTLVMVFIALTLTARAGHPLTWRTPLAFLIFAVKGWLLLSIRWSTFEQRDALARAGAINRRDADRRRTDRRREQ